jgi:hypothetical protein
MDAPKQAIRNDKNKEHGKDDLRKGRQDGRYEGGRDSDKPRQAEGREAGGDKDKFPSPDPMPGHKRPGSEEEE